MNLKIDPTCADDISKAIEKYGAFDFKCVRNGTIHYTAAFATSRHRIHANVVCDVASSPEWPCRMSYAQLKPFVKEVVLTL